MQPQIKTINLLRLSSGDNLALQVYQFLGKKTDQKIYIQANLHGAEIVGNVVIKQLLDWLISLDEEQLFGEVWLVPACNPLGMNQRSHFFNSGRYNSYDGKDWNRIFWDYDTEKEDIYHFAKDHLEADHETIYQNYLHRIKTRLEENIQWRKQASAVPYSVKYQQVLQSLCLDAKIVIDIHSSSNQGVDYLFTFPGQEAMTQNFLLDVGILVNQPKGYTFDEAFIKPWLSLKKVFKNLGRNLDLGLASWTLELGNGMSAKSDSVEKGVQGIKNYLASLGVVKVSDFPLTHTEKHPLQLVTKNQLKEYYAPTGGIVKNCLQLQTNVVAGEVIYQILEFNKKGKQPEIVEVKAEASGWIFDRGTNEAVNEGEYVLTMLEKEGNNE
ncbi:M14 family zinc carboxypeptidase [Dactylococcopsis salina]|uniref:Deacylase n=1 Tax=Dactylococcopsis salina (strain PCC 8305) TaxID=13035 RepID=K9YQ26_DACS8|nr:succinylglutamate desuccinylase/aspartoacylase family protein [Dactylococcopsis salina]AFZ49031.1 putative deacylase [Dactylococcopsis salina PCC 8305]